MAIVLLELIDPPEPRARCRPGCWSGRCRCWPRSGSACPGDGRVVQRQATVNGVVAADIGVQERACGIVMLNPFVLISAPPLRTLALPLK